jgi:hypothetical protein
MPAQIVNADAEQRVRATRSAAYREPHANRGGMPSRSGEAAEDRFPGSLFIEVKGLRIEFECKTHDVCFGYSNRFTLEFHAEGRRTIQPLSHSLPSFRQTPVCSLKSFTMHGVARTRRSDSFTSDQEEQKS